MKLNKLKLKNYSCFLDAVELNFGKGLNIVNAGNGYGKSKFLDSINWVISNQIFHGDVWKNADELDLYPLWYTNPDNKQYYEEKEVITEVTLEFTAPDIDNNIEKNTVWYFTKKRYHKREGTKLNRNRDELTIKYINNETGEQVILGKHREFDVIETLFPKALRKFMWFQGEAFKEISLSHDNKEFNKVLDTISHYPIYGKMVKRASKAIIKKENALTRLRREQRGLSNEQSENLYEKDRLLIKIPELENKLIPDLQSDIDDHENKIADYEDFLKNSVEYVKIDREIKQKESDIRHINQSIEEYEISKVNMLIKRWAIAGSKSHIESFQEKIDYIQNELNKIDNTKIPLHIPGPEMVQDMIDDMKCHICDREIPDEDHESYHALLKRLEVFKEGKKEKWLRKNFDIFKRMKSNALSTHNEIEESIKNHKKKIQEKIRKRNKLNSEKDVFQDKLKGLSTSSNTTTGENYDLYFSKKQEKEKNLRNLKLRLGGLKNNLSKYKNKLKELNEEIRSFQTDNNDINLGEESLKYFEVLVDSLKKLEQDAKENLENEITHKSNSLFNIYYDNPGIKIKIKNGNVKLFDKSTSDEIDIRNLNKSQKEMIKFSVINSLLKLSNEKLGNSLPLIADAPTSSSEWTNTKYFTENVGDNFDQVILFSKDYIEQCEDPNVKTQLINLCLKQGGSWHWTQKVDKNGNSVGRKFDNPKSDSESKTVITESILK